MLQTTPFQSLDSLLNNLAFLILHASDNCHPRVLKEIKDGLILPLYLLFNKSLQESSLPSCWKLATVTSIHKEGDTNLPSNYRPISLTSIFCRMLESIIKNRIMSYFQANDFFLQ